MAHILVGTSGWMYKDWGDTFYPPEIKDAEKLTYISHRFETLEVNTSFYHFVKKSTYEKWHRESAENFIFSVKASRYYTHRRKLNIDEEVENSLELFFQSLEALQEKLWAILFQLPGSSKKEEERLDFFLKVCGKYVKKMKHQPDLAFEFRHPDWFTESVYRILEKHNTALVIANSSRYPYEVRTTADFSYMRFHGPESMFLGKYSEKELNDWKEKIDTLSGSLKKVYIYFNNDLDANAVENAQYLAGLYGMKMNKD